MVPITHTNGLPHQNSKLLETSPLAPSDETSHDHYRSLGLDWMRPISEPVIGDFLETEFGSGDSW